MGLASTGCFLFVNCRRTWAEFSAQDAVSPVSTLHRFPYFSLPGFSHDTGGSVSTAPGTQFLLFGKRRLFTFLTRKSLGPHHLLPSLANHHENHIIKVPWKGEDQTVPRVEETAIPPEGRMHGSLAQADACPGEGWGSPILDYKMVRVHVRFYGKVILLWKGTKIKDLRVIFYCVGWRKKIWEKDSLDSQRGNLKFHPHHAFYQLVPRTSKWQEVTYLGRSNNLLTITYLSFTGKGAITRDFVSPRTRNCTKLTV